MARNLKKNLINRFLKNQDRLSVGTIVGHSDELAARLNLQHGAAESERGNTFGMLNTAKVYFTLRSRWIAGRGDPRIEMVPVEDVLQEINTALLEIGGRAIGKIVEIEWTREAFATAKNAVSRLCSQYGYGVRHRKELSLSAHDSDDGDLFGSWAVDNSDNDVLSEAKQNLVEQILSWYEAGFTVKEICEKLGVEYNHSKQTAMHRLFPRNTGKRGGQRPNRKGSMRFICTACNHARTDRKPKNHVSQCERKCSHCGMKTIHDVSLFGEENGT